MRRAFQLIVLVKDVVQGWAEINRGKVSRSEQVSDGTGVRMELSGMGIPAISD